MYIFSRKVLFKSLICEYHLNREISKQVKVKLATVVEGDLKAPFSRATTPRSRGVCYSSPWIDPITLHTYLILLSVKQGGIKYHFLSLWYDSTRDWTQVSRAPGEHANHHANIRITKKYNKNDEFRASSIAVVDFIIFDIILIELR